MVENIRDRITSLQFSYKNDENIYALAKNIKKHMSTDTDNGKGNEFESLKYVLNEYIDDIDELKNI